MVGVPGGCRDCEQICVLEVPGDGDVFAILDAVAHETLSATAIARETGISSTTLYRRLGELADAGYLDQTLHPGRTAITTPPTRRQSRGST